jgi:ELWxxDGT repeat protein
MVRSSICLLLLTVSTFAATPVEIKLPKRAYNAMILGQTEDLLYYSCIDGGDAQGPHTTLYATDGTPKGTRKIKGLLHNGIDGFGFTPNNPDAPTGIPLGNQLYFTTDPTTSSSYSSGYVIVDEIPEPIYNATLWVTDGTEKGTRDISSYFTTTSSRRFKLIAAYQGSMYLSYGNALWKTDGTAAGTVKIATAYDAFSHPVIADGHLYIHATKDYGSYAAKLVIDGSTATPAPLAEPDSTPGNKPTFFSLLNGKLLLLSASDSAHDGLWSWDLTSTQADFLSTLSFSTYTTSFSTHIYPSSIPAITLGSTAYFTQSSSTSDSLWSTDGTTSGTRLIRDDLSPGTQTIHDNTSGLWLLSQQSDQTYHLTLSDGTTSGTRHLSELTDFKKPYQSNIQPLALDGPLAYYARSSGGLCMLDSRDGSLTTITQITSTSYSSRIRSGFVRFHGSSWFTTMAALHYLPFTSPTEVPAPLCFTGTPTVKKGATATTLTGYITTLDQATTAWFEIASPDTDTQGQHTLLLTTKPTSLSRATTTRQVTAALKDLTPGTRYAIRLVNQSGDQLSYGEYRTLTVPGNGADIPSIVLSHGDTTWTQTVNLDFATTTITLPDSRDTIHISAWHPSADPAAQRTVTIQGQPYTSQTPTIPFKLKPGKNTLKILSTSADKKTKATYTLTLIRLQAS